MKKQTTTVTNKAKLTLHPTKIKVKIRKKTNTEEISTLDVSSFELKSFYLNSKDLFLENNTSILVSVRHANLQSQIDMTGLSKMQIISFEENGNFIGRTIINNNYSAPLTFLNLGKKILICSSNVLQNVQIIGLKK